MYKHCLPWRPLVCRSAWARPLSVSSHLKPVDDVRFQIYHGGAVHPTHGDEARERAATSARVDWGIFGEARPSTAILALRHPCLNNGELSKVKSLYASKLEEGASVAVVQDPLGVFARTKLLQPPSEETATWRVLSWQSESEQGSGRTVRSPVESVPACDVFGGWPALSLVLSHPLRRLEHEVAFMWPAPVSSVVIMRDGEAICDRHAGLGSLLRSSEQLSISIDGVEYPLEHDRCASAAGKMAAKDRDRKALKYVIWSQAGGCCILLLLWAILEWQMAGKFTQSHQACCTLQHGPDVSTSHKHFKDFSAADEQEDDGWSSVHMGCNDSVALPGEIWADTSSWHPDNSCSNCT
eukprot:TRINITY_DN29922_c0_g1_i1.p1 TRINITY_DN29922_c0_g1~~TRINITY_DN29922_c0_g1_i1.p1  ORF type:complete len:361 (+),score=43.72 TRINITY_DN29922_c0_g1_i1:27-1085(+)